MRDYEPLPRTFFAPSAETVARELLGQLLLRNDSGKISGGVIVETEAYLEGDPACHAFRGPTTRNQIMFGPPGYAYVYFIYGCHHCVNAVCNSKGRGEAVLIRAIEPVLGCESIQFKRDRVRKQQHLANGPGKVCAALGIDRSLNGADLCETAGPLMIAANPQIQTYRERHGPIMITPRVGITLAAELPLRFVLARSRFLSRAPKSSLAPGPRNGGAEQFTTVL